MNTAVIADSLATVFADHLRRRAQQYFPGVDDCRADVRLIRADVRSASTLYEYRLSIGAGTYDVLVKVLPRQQPSEIAHRESAFRVERPHLAQRLPGEAKCEFEYRALSMIHDYFRTMDDPRFGTVRVFDCIPAHRALLMEVVRQPPLRRLYLRSTLWPIRASRVDLVAVFRNAGAWLRLYHALPVKEPVEQRHTQRHEFVDHVREVSAFLGARVGDESFFEWVSATVARVAEESVPETLPLGLSHGDYAMRNILVDPRSRITVIDTIGRWRTSVYEDLASFLVGLRASGPQILDIEALRRFCCTARYEQAFLTGYFGQENVPHVTLALYEIQAMLNKWAAIAGPPARRAGRRAGVMRSANKLVICRFFRSQIQHKLVDACR